MRHFHVVGFTVSLFSFSSPHAVPFLMLRPHSLLCVSQGITYNPCPVYIYQSWIPRLSLMNKLQTASRTIAQCP